MTSVTPIKQPPLEDLRNALQVCVCYEDEKNIAATDAQRQLGRIRGLIAQAIAKLEEPAEVTIEAARRVLGGVAVELDDRSARDVAAVVTHVALTWGIGDEL